MYLITGGAGFIGSHIVQKVVAMGESVRVLDNFSSGKRANLAGLGDKVEIVCGDILDLEIVKKAADGVRRFFIKLLCARFLFPWRTRPLSTGSMSRAR